MRGARNFVHDVRHNGGMPSQVDTRPFRKGENVAATPGAVVYRDEVCEVIQYTPSTPEVRTRPVLMIPPQINRYYFMDLAPGRSFVEHAVSRGLQYFTISWRNPTVDAVGLEPRHLRRGVPARGRRGQRDHAQRRARPCSGCAPAASRCRRCSARWPRAVTSASVAASFGVTLLDFSVPAPVGMFLSPRLLGTARKQSERKGLLAGEDLGKVFAWLRPERPGLQLLGQQLPDGQRPAGLRHPRLEQRRHPHGRRTAHAVPGHLRAQPDRPAGRARGARRSRSTSTKVTCDNYVTGAVTDHLTPWQGCYQTTQLLGGDSTFVLSNAGHIQSLVNPPGNPKARMFTGPEPGPDAAEWRAGGHRAGGHLVGALGGLGDRARRRDQARSGQARQPQTQGRRRRPRPVHPRRLITMPATERFVDAGDLRLRVSCVAGDGRPLLLIGGIGANIEMWRPLRRALAGRPTIAFDAPGTGRSQTPRWPLRMRGLAELVTRLVHVLGEREVDVLGYSFGGALAQQLAHDRPRLVRRLILAATSAGMVSVPASPHVLALMATPWRYYSPRHLRRVAPIIAGGRTAREPQVLGGHVADRLKAPPSLRGYQWQLAAITGWTSAHWLHRIGQPTLVLAGDDDPLVPVANARFLAHRIPRARLHVVRGGGHLFLIDQPHDVVDVVGAFLAKEQP